MLMACDCLAFGISGQNCQGNKAVLRRKFSVLARSLARCPQKMGRSLWMKLRKPAQVIELKAEFRVAQKLHADCN
ncbi:hypothetical protein Q9Q94_09750 [Uliginosibacterium sp. 31-16]|uniref:hypothetical protein n=1 Tax=Uliginosibacterium sp. 31-16 TaxID=3068315 RepID=UPI00273D790C|nr:hypothetical protein [Uliginosibacterium sp. 31-16]MDP5239816.1 hypothetical protein [Uliginosibacterium sp. 31-16]